MNGPGFRGPPVHAKIGGCSGTIAAFRVSCRPDVQGHFHLMKLVFALCIVVFSTIPGQAAAAEGDAARAAIQKIAPMQQVTAFRKSALPGYYEGVIDGQVAYASDDGRYLAARIGRRHSRKASTSAKPAWRPSVVSCWQRWAPDTRLSFAPARPEYRVTVFTDVDCPYCRRLHSRINEYNALGIAFDYVFFPLSIHPGADLKSIAVWCSADRKLRLYRGSARAVARSGRLPQSAGANAPGRQRDRCRARRRPQLLQMAA